MLCISMKSEWGDILYKAHSKNSDTNPHDKYPYHTAAKDSSDMITKSCKAKNCYNYV